ncbi:unnamed protein product, partial [Mesocestoides corti]|uniref:Methyltransferase-like protein 15 n=1 Tax=Mesocestoides corti TaxID=53468 RepID=A0A0R3UMH1_MESCO
LGIYRHRLLSNAFLKLQVFVDFTFGAGGHTRALLSACPDITVYCLDCDPLAINYAKDLSISTNRFASMVGAMLVLLIFLNHASAIPTSKVVVEGVTDKGDHKVLSPSAWRVLVRFVMKKAAMKVAKDAIKSHATVGFANVHINHVGEFVCISVHICPYMMLHLRVLVLILLCSVLSSGSTVHLDPESQKLLQELSDNIEDTEIMAETDDVLEAARIRQWRVIPVQGRFSESLALLTDVGCTSGTVNGVVMDLGASSMQMDSPDRGFGLSTNSPLDMRMSFCRKAR